MDSSKVHPDLRPQYQRYKILGAGLVVSSILPAVTFFIFYSSNAGLAYLSKHLLTVMVAFILEIPLMLGLAYILSVKRMRFLERSTQLCSSGVRQELLLAGAYKIKNQGGNNACFLELVLQDGTLERFPVIPSSSIQPYINSLPEPPAVLAPVEQKPSYPDAEKVHAFVDTDTKLPVAVEVAGNILWISPPAKLV